MVNAPLVSLVNVSQKILVNLSSHEKFPIQEPTELIKVRNLI